MKNSPRMRKERWLRKYGHKIKDLQSKNMRNKKRNIELMITRDNKPSSISGKSRKSIKGEERNVKSLQVL